MSAKIVAVATPADVTVCNTLQPPVAGCNAGGGIHIQIPSDWATRIAQGIDVQGCTYARLESDGSLLVTDVVQTALNIPADVVGIAAAEVASLNARLAAASQGASASQGALSS